MTNQELASTIGGSSINASWLNALARGIEVVYNLGRSLGTGVRMLVKKTKC
jgi:hypothetical protein